MVCKKSQNVPPNRDSACANVFSYVVLQCRISWAKSADLYGRQVTGLRSHLSRIRLGEKNRESENEGSRGLFNELMDGYEHKVITKS